MQRRNFLRMIGAVIATPLMPAASMGRVAGAAPYTPAALHGAILHAQARCSVSSWSLAQTLEVPVTQANALMVELADRGVLGQMRGRIGGSRWATSNIFKPQFAPYRPVSKAGAQRDLPRDASQNSQPDLSLLMAHLRDISSRYFAAQAA